MKLAKRFTLKTSPQIGNQDLRALVEPHCAAVKGCFVTEARKVLCEQVHQSRSRLVGVVDAVDETAVVLFIQYTAGLAETLESLFKERDLLVGG